MRSSCRGRSRERGIRFGAHCLLAVLASWFAAAAHAGETEVVVPPGTYDLGEVVDRSGTAENWIRYRPETPGSVTIRGGGTLQHSYVILDGFRFDASLDPDYQDPDNPRASGLTVAADHVRIENCEIAGVNDVHNGYNTLNQRDCHEFADGVGGTGLGVRSRDVTLSNVVLYGFREAGSVSGDGELEILASLVRNNFNGISLSGRRLVVRDSVFWDHPNHQFSIKTTVPGSEVRLENTLFANSQDMVKAGGNWDGVDRLVVVHNTFWIPPNDPCGEYAGINSSNVRDEIIIRDNLFVNLRNGIISSEPAQVSILNSDYNLIYQHDPITPPDEFRWAGQKTPIETWRQVTCEAGRCQDAHTVARQEPLFADPPSYADPLPETGSAANAWGWRIPASVAEARAWLRLRDGSPGKGAASDGLDMGIVETSLPQNCGNGTLDPGELCDPGPPEQLNGQDCTTIGAGFTGGALHCSASCASWDVSACTTSGGNPPPAPQRLRRTDVRPDNG